VLCSKHNDEHSRIAQFDHDAFWADNLFQNSNEMRVFVGKSDCGLKNSTSSRGNPFQARQKKLCWRNVSMPFILVGKSAKIRLWEEMCKTAMVISGLVISRHQMKSGRTKRPSGAASL
jgi:hypothetical protein